MASILISSGFKSLESLQEFSNRFPHILNPLDEELKKIWICHKTPEEIPKFEEINLLPNEEYYCLSIKIKKKIHSAKDFLSLMTEFSPLSIFDKIYSHFKNPLATYLCTKCYIFYNWGVNAFEPIFDHFEIHKQIEKSQKMTKPIKGNQKKNVKNFNNYSDNCKSDDPKNRTKSREKSVDLFEEPANDLAKTSKSRVNVKALKEAMQKAGKFFDMSKNSNNPYQETFNSKKILYDMKQRPKWPAMHVLSKDSIEDLIIFIIQIPINVSFFVEDKLLNEHHNWCKLRQLLGKFILQHKLINKNNGYGRILKKHLKNVTMLSERRLFAVPKTVVCSYVIDILRRVLPLELFGSNRLRKHFLQGIIKVIKGMKEQNFIWHSLLHLILKNKAELAWCSELGDNYIQSQMILKLFKFLVIHYIFILLRNNFYITETGSSGFGLRFYRKNDMESRSVICLSNLLEKKHIRPLRKQDYDQRTIERNWLETGLVNVEDVKGKVKKTMDRESQYKQPIARVRFLPKSDESDELRMITFINERMPKGSGVGNKKLERFFMLRLSWRKKKLFFVKLLLEFLVDKYGFGIRPEPFNPVLEAAWKKVVHLRESYGKLFFVKADISDAFGSVKHNILTQILRRTLEENSRSDRIQLKRIIEWKKARWKIEKVVRFSFSNRPKENSIMINRSVSLYHKKKINQCYDSTFLDIIEQVVMKQRVEIRGRVFRLIKGLAQGSAGRFSPQLCEIYYSSMDVKYFKEFINASDSVLLRAVDDYLLITSDLEKAVKFLESVQKGINEYEVRFKSSKLQSNLIENINEVPYLGLIFNFEDMSVKPNYSKYQRTCLLSKLNLFDQWGNIHFKKGVFLKRRSLRINCLKLHSIVLNSVQNNLKIIRQTIFEACLLQSIRVITLANYLYSDGVRNDLEVYKILLTSCNKIARTVGPDLLSKDEVRWLFFFAASNILRRWSGQFKLLLMITRFQLEKCEKAFSKVASELLLDFLKNDIIDEDYWGRVSSFFKELGNKPKFSESSLRKACLY